MDWLLELAIEGAIAAGAYLVADAVVEDTTGKHIHEHVYAWWRSFMDSVVEFLHAYPQIPANHVMLQVLTWSGELVDTSKHYLDDVFRVEALVGTPYGEYYSVTEEQVTLGEFYEQFPECTGANQVAIEL